MIHCFVDEIPTIYDFEPEKEANDIQTSIKDDIAKMMSEGKYYKALKRLELVAKGEKKQSMIKKALLNPYFGYIHASINKLNALQLVGIPDNFRKKSIDSIKSILRRIGALNKNRMDKLNNPTKENLAYLSKNLQDESDHFAEPIVWKVLK